MNEKNIDYCTLLYEKVQEEYKQLLSRLVRLHPTEILDRAYEKVIKEEIVGLLKNEELTQEWAKALYEIPCPLDAIYNEWLENDYSYLDVIRDTICDKASSEAGE